MEYYSIMELDKKDFLVLEALKGNSKQTTNAIARRTAIPVTTVHNRIKRLEHSGIIKSYTVQLNHEKLNQALFSIILVTVTYSTPSGDKISQKEIAKRIRKIPGVESASIVTGVTDILVQVRVKDVQSLNKLIIEHLRTVEGVDKTQTMVVLEEF